MDYGIKVMLLAIKIEIEHKYIKSYFRLGFGTWETTDCEEVVIDLDNNVRSCECKHLAHFGLLFVSCKKVFFF